jgi:hypothetical protein
LISHTGKFLGVVHCNSATVVRSLVGKQNQQPFCPILRVSKGSIFFVKDDRQRKPKWTATRAFICGGLCDAAFAISNGTDLVVISLTENDLRFGHFSLPDKWMFRKLLFTNNGSTIFLLSRREGEERLDAFLVENLLLKRNHSEPQILSFEEGINVRSWSVEVNIARNSVDSKCISLHTKEIVLSENEELVALSSENLLGMCVMRLLRKEAHGLWSLKSSTPVHLGPETEINGMALYRPHPENRGSCLALYALKPMKFVSCYPAIQWGKMLRPLCLYLSPRVLCHKPRTRPAMLQLQASPMEEKHL